VVFDNLVAGHREAVKYGTFVAGDVTDLAAVRDALRRHAIFGVMHFAAFLDVGESVREPAKYYRNNVVGALTVLEAMAAESVRFLVFSSTCATYGEPIETPIEETHPQQPINSYGETKLAVERALPHFDRAYGIRSVALRYFNASGADPGTNGSLDARSAAAGRSGGAVCGGPQGAGRAALDAAVSRARRDRAHGVELALHASAGVSLMPRQRVTLRRLFAYSRPYRGRLAWAIVGMIVYAIGSAGLAYLIRPIFDSLLPKQQYVAWTAWAIVGVYLLKGVGSYVSSYLMADGGQRVVMDLRNALYRHILDQSASFFAHVATGRLLSRINNDVGQVQQAVSETAGDLARETLALAGYAALLFYYDARLTLVCLTGAPLIVYPLIRLGKRVRRTTRRSQEALELISHLSAEAFTGHRIVKAFGTERHEAE